MLTLRDVVASRGLLRLLFSREMETRFAGSILGFFWNYIGPITQVLIYVVIFSMLLAPRVGGEENRLSFVINLTSGIVLWLYFCEVLTRSTQVLMENAAILKKTPVHPELLFLGAFLVSSAIYLGALLALILFLFIAGAPFGVSILLALPLFFLTGLLGLGAGMILAVLQVLVRDIGPLLNIVLMVGFWSLPIVYPVELVPDWYRDLLPLHPVYGNVAGIQAIFSDGASPWNPAYLIGMLFLPLTLLVAGRAFLSRQRSAIVDTL